MFVFKMNSVKERFTACCSKFKESPINALSLTFKDPEVNRRFVEQDRLVVVDRAKMFLAYNVFLLLLSPALLVYDKLTFAYVCALLLSTCICTTACLIAAKFRLIAIEFVLPVNGLGRIIVKMVILQMIDRSDCVPSSLFLYLEQVNIFIFATELILFQMS